MNKSADQKTPRRRSLSAAKSRIMLVLLITIEAISCKDIGRGGTGELVIPQRELRQIKSAAPEDFARPATRPLSTLPSTRASTVPLAEVPLTLAEARQRALANNL